MGLALHAVCCTSTAALQHGIRMEDGRTNRIRPRMHASKCLSGLPTSPRNTQAHLAQCTDRATRHLEHSFTGRRASAVPARLVQPWYQQPTSGSSTLSLSGGGLPYTRLFIRQSSQVGAASNRCAMWCACKGHRRRQDAAYITLVGHGGGPSSIHTVSQVQATLNPRCL